MAESNLANSRRPRRFGDVLGQEHAVAFLSGVVKAGRNIPNGTMGVSVLLHGDYGSGKTTLARIYCKALNCLAPTEDGSPCDACEGCNAPLSSDRHQELQWVPRPNVLKWLEEHNIAAVNTVKCRTLLIDEAHLLTDAEMAAMLQAVESPADRVVFCFATTDPHRLIRPLRSRLVDLAVTPLPMHQAVELLKTATVEEAISCELKALELLAALKAGHPRDLLNGLQQVAHGAHAVTLDRVRFVFDIDHADILTRYFNALGNGNLEQQTKIIFEWRERPADKTRWIIAFLTSLYYNDILRQELVLDGVVHLIQEGRGAIIERFRQRLGGSDAVQLASYWRSLMAFWSIQNAGHDEATINLQLTLFHHHVNKGLAGLPEGDDGLKQHATPAVTASVPTARTAGVTMHGNVIAGRPFPAPAWLNTLPSEYPVFFGLRDARELINRASYLTQEHGVWLNTCIELRLFQLGACNEEDAREVMQDFTSRLKEQVEAWGWSQAPFAHLTRLENNEDGWRATMALHLPRPTRSGGVGTDCVLEARAWIRHHIEPDAGEDAITFMSAERLRGSAVSQHRRYVLRLCAGLGDDVAVATTTPGEREAIASLKAARIIPNRISTWIKGPVIAYSELLQDQALEIASRNRMEPLSAFDAAAWGWLETGWEIQEFESRKKTKQKRAEEVHDLAAKFGPDGKAIEAALEDHAKQWPINAEHRKRRWRGWWFPEEV